MLHASLLDLSEHAPRCSSAAEFSGILAEASDLMRNAFNHDADALAVTGWYADNVRALLNSPAGCDLSETSIVVPTGAYSRGLGLPSRSLHVVCLTQSHTISELPHPLAVACKQGGLRVRAVLPETTGDITVTTNSLLDRATTGGKLNNKDSEFLLAAADLSPYNAVRHLLPLDKRSLPLLFTTFLAHRPRTIQWKNGLPDRDITINITRDIITPIVDIARWASVLIASTERSTVARLQAAAKAKVFPAGDAEELSRAFQAACALYAQRWLERVVDYPTMIRDLPGIQRTQYGACARAVASMIDTLAHRYEPESTDPYTH